VLARITALIKQRRPGLLVIDSFKALQDYASDAETFPRFLHELAGRLSATLLQFLRGSPNSNALLPCWRLAVASTTTTCGDGRSARKA